MIGTVQLNFVDTIKRPLVQKAMDPVTFRPCGSWCLVVAKDSVANLEELKKHHDTQQKN